MAECRFCSAPVSRHDKFCSYCNSRVELDLHGTNYRLYEPESERICPKCDVPLTTIDLKIDKKFLIEKCDQCNGLFFDPGELEMLLSKTVSNVFHIDENKLSELQTKHAQAREKDFKYVKCPACQVLMNRRPFGHKSGVIVDHCNKHGYWLDEGELRQLQEWKKAGGELKQKSAGQGTLKDNPTGYGYKQDTDPSPSYSTTHSQKDRFSTMRQSTDFGLDDLFSLLLD